MSLEGKLEDVSVADLLQFIHVGRRTGTLALRSSQQNGTVAFHDGAIVGARSPSSQKIADLLILNGTVSPEGLQEAVRIQSRTPDVPLARILMTEFQVPEEEIRGLVQEQIEAAIRELVTWHRGSFEFMVDELTPSEDQTFFTGDAIVVSLNTQAILLDAMRIHDESAAQAPDPLRAIPGEITNVTPLPELVRSPTGSLSVVRGSEAVPRRNTGTRAAVARQRVQFVSTDADLVGHVASQFWGETDLVCMRVAYRDAGLPLPGEEPPLVVIDLRDGRIAPESLATFRKARPRMTLAAVVANDATALKAYQAGVIVALIPDPAVIAAAIRSIVQYAPGGGAEYSSSGLKRLRKVFAEIRSGVITTTLGINLMNVVGQTADRAVLFLVKPSQLGAIGAFGFTGDGRPLALTTRDLVLPMAGENAILTAVTEGKSAVLNYDEAGMPPEFDRAVGHPSSGQMAVFPVFGGQRAFCVIYADNGKRPEALTEVDVLELAVTQVGLAFENELLRRHLAKHRRGE